MRTARKHDKTHLDYIRQLPCTVCADNTSTEAAHVRMADGRIGKPITGIGIRPDDGFVLPLCGDCHRRQHSTSERKFWEAEGIDAILTALALEHYTGDYQRGLEILRAANDQRQQ